MSLESLETFEYKFAVPAPSSSGENTIGGSSRTLSLAIFRRHPPTGQDRFRGASAFWSRRIHGGRRGRRMQTMSDF